MILNKIIDSLSKLLCIDKADINADSNLINDLGADSLDIVQMLIALERDFNMTFDDDEIRKIKTVGDVAELIEKKTANK